MKRVTKKFIVTLMIVLLIFTHLMPPNIATAATGDVCIEQNEYDKKVIPDKYNTSPKGKLTKVKLEDTVNGVYFRVGNSNGKDIRVMDFYYQNKDVSGTIVFDNYDFSDYGVTIYNADLIDRNIKLIFNNCKFSSVSFPKGRCPVTGEFNNCSFNSFYGGNATFNYCQFGQSYSDGIVPFQDVNVNSCFFYDFTTMVATGGEVHTDGTQIYGHKDIDVENVFYDNCRFEIPPITPAGSTAYVNACIMLQTEYSSANNVHFSNCYVNGGGFTVYAHSKFDYLTLNNISFKNIKFGCASKYGKFYSRFNPNVVLDNIPETDSLYVGSVWKESGQTHVSVTNDTNIERTLTIVTDKGTFNHTIPACPTSDKFDSSLTYAKLPFDIDISIPKDCNYVICYDTTVSGFANQIRFVNWSNQNVYLDKATADKFFSHKVEIIASGECGKNITYTLTNTGVLTLSGTGATYNYHSGNRAPWTPYARQIKEVVIEEGIEALGAQLFSGCCAITKITLPESLNSISGRTFAGCSSLTEITLPGNLKTIGDAAFSGAMLQKVYYNGDDYNDITIGANNDNLINHLPSSVTPVLSVSYRTHVQSIGWQDKVSDGVMSGTSGMSKRLEGIEISVNGNSNVGIQYTTHCQTYGWLPWSCNGEMNGTEGEAKRLEAIKIQLTGTEKDRYDIYYRVHAQTYGWLNWAKNGEPSGTAGYAKRLEGIQIVIVKKGASFDKNIGKITSTNNQAYIALPGDSPVVGAPNTDALNPIIPNVENTNIAYKTHVQTYGWQGWKYNGAMSGTSGEAKRLEGINIKLTNKQYKGSIAYTTHVQTYGWQGDIRKSSTWKKDGEMSGTSGEAKRLEAICIALTGEISKYYDVYYRVHAQTYGWLGWAKNGAPSGTAGHSKRLEGIQIVLVPKGQAAPADNYGGITSNNANAYIE